MDHCRQEYYRDDRRRSRQKCLSYLRHGRQRNNRSARKTDARRTAKTSGKQFRAASSAWRPALDRVMPRLSPRRYSVRPCVLYLSRAASSSIFKHSIASATGSLAFDRRVADVTVEIEQLAKGDGHCKSLMAVPGIGPMTASAIVAAIGNGAAFSKGRDFAAWLGLVPKQISTGDRTVLGGISRRGNKYLRTLFIQGARSVLQRSDGWANKSFGRWLRAASKRLHKNVLAAALANKLARVARAVLYHARSYDSSFTPNAT
jgi:Transposase IS116/IS110/IS902 family